MGVGEGSDGVDVGVCVPGGVTVNVGEGEGVVGVTPSIDMSSSCPGVIRLQLGSALRVQIASAVVPYRVAMPVSVSPGCTTWVIGAYVGVGLATGVGVAGRVGVDGGAGLDTPVGGAGPQAAIRRIKRPILRSFLIAPAKAPFLRKRLCSRSAHHLRYHLSLTKPLTIEYRL